MNRNEIEFYNHNVPAIRRALERIADALENQNQFVVNTIKAKNHKASFEAKEQEELDTHHDYLHGLVQDMDNDAYNEFCNTHCLPASDTVAVTNYITDLDYDEVLGIIKEIEEEYPFGGKSDDQANEDAIESQNDYPNGVTYDDDYDLRVTAKMYEGELEHGQFSTKKDCILDYVTNEFGSQGARYTDIIKFAYYLNNPNSPKFGYDNRGYYACAMTHNRWGFGHLVSGGKDFFVKGINKEGNERYFAHSFVESVTDYWKFCDNTK
jgi:hypothetical protein